MPNMEQKDVRKYKIAIDFEEVSLPPFEDILVVGKKSPHGKTGLTKCFQFLIPDEFEVLGEVNPSVDSVFIHRKLLQKMGKDTILSVLEKQVFPYIEDHEITRVDFKPKTSCQAIAEE